MQEFFRQQLQQKQADLYNKGVRRSQAHHRLISCIAQFYNEEVHAGTELSDVDTYILDVLRFMVYAYAFSQRGTGSFRFDVPQMSCETHGQLPDDIFQESLAFDRLLCQACEDFDFSSIHDMILAIRSEIAYRRYALHRDAQHADLAQR